MSTTTTLSLLLARRHKRLHFWNERLQCAPLEASVKKEFEVLFNRYSATITKMANTAEPDALASLESEAETIERELTSRFEARRMMTNKLGVPADCA